MKAFSCVFAVVFLILTGCALDDDPQNTLEIVTYSFDFDEGEQEWTAGFSEYRPEDSSDYALQYAYTDSPLGNKKAIKLSSNNVGGDLFMYLKHRVSGLDPGSIYTITFQVEIISNAPYSDSDPGGYPGENVYLKVGASDAEPKNFIENNYYTLNVDKGNGNASGNEMISIGNISTPAGVSGWGTVTLSNSSYSNAGSSYSENVNVKPDKDGRLWIIVGTDSAYKGPTTIYYAKITAVLSRS